MSVPPCLITHILGPSSCRRGSCRIPHFSCQQAARVFRNFHHDTIAHADGPAAARHTGCPIAGVAIQPNRLATAIFYLHNHLAIRQSCHGAHHMGVAFVSFHWAETDEATAQDQ